MAKYRAKQSFEHFPADGDPAVPASVVVEAGSTVSNIHPDSIDGLLASGIIEEVKGSKAAAGGEED